MEFLVVGRGLRIEGAVECVTIRHATLVPDNITCDCEPCNPNEPSITLRSHGRLRVQHSIIGGIHVFDDEVRADPTTIDIGDSIVDATDTSHPAVGTQRAGIAHAAVTIVRSTIVGTVWTHVMPLAENSILLGNACVARRQIGCIRYCYVAEESRTPRRHRCQPDLVRAAASAIDSDFEAARVVPRFTSRRYGKPGYAQLADACAQPEIRTGADDESEMGAFHELFAAARGWRRSANADGTGRLRLGRHSCYLERPSGARPHPELSMHGDFSQHCSTPALLERGDSAGTRVSGRRGQRAGGDPRSFDPEFGA